MVIKTIVEKSNPQLIREYRVSNSLTSDELAAVIAAAYSLHSYEIENISGDELAEGDNIADILTGEYYHIRLMDYPCLPISLEILDRTDCADEKVTLLRKRGYQIPDFCDNLVLLNKIMNKWENEIAFYSEEKHEWCRAEHYSYSVEYLNQRIGHYMSSGRKRAKFNHRFDVPYMQMLEKKSIYDLQQMCLAGNISLKDKANKYDLIYGIIGKICTGNFYRWYLDICSISEYTAFREICFSANLDEKHKKELFNKLTYLSSFYLADTKNFHIATEFMEYMDDWFFEEDERDFIFEKRLKTIVIVSARLYGVIRKAVVREIYMKVYPDYYDEIMFEMLWNDSYILSFDEDILSLMDEYYYVKDMNALEAYRVLDEWEDDTPWYIPTAAELEDIEKRGLSFDYYTHEKLVVILRMHSGSKGYLVRRLAGEVAAIIHRGQNEEQAVSYIKSQLGYLGNDEKKLLELISNGKKSIRMMSYKGYTEEEYKEVVHNV